ncbi:Alpha/Beta hydrolase protein [Exophiala viscosa]|uniref:Alpha/Beta hydrolase protein n=1 Tax=Exophiala viscosa TaxID=2486360 RepID=A0AAN6E4W7_9EURO|nr:Alpha/Beta hydrolase protein [Exophiala viscosa]
MSKPTILLVPGSFALPEFYNEMFDKIRAKGYDIQGIHKPTVGLSAGQGRPGPAPSMYDDAAHIAKEVEKVADAGKDVVLIGHSYGGVPVTEAVKGLPKKEREAQGKKGGLVNLAYMTCLVPAVGSSAADVLSKVPDDFKTPFAIGEDGWMSHVSAETTGAIIMQTVPLEVAAGWVRKMPNHSARSFADPLTYPGYRNVPVSYLFCEIDQCIPPGVQQEGIDIIEKESGNKVHVTRIHADHCPNFTAMDETVDWIVDIAERVQKQ